MASAFISLDALSIFSPFLLQANQKTDMACYDYRFVRSPNLSRQSVQYDLAMQNVQESSLLYGKRMHHSSLTRGFQTVSLSGTASCLPALAPRKIFSRSSAFYCCAPATCHSASASILKADSSLLSTRFSLNLIALHAVNASITELSDMEPSALSRIVRISHGSRTDGSQNPHHSPPSFMRRVLAMFTLNFLLAFSSLPCSRASSAVSLLPEHLLVGHLSTPLCALSSSVQETTPLITPITTLAVLDLPWNNHSVSWNQNGKSVEVEVGSEEGNCATCLGEVDGTLGACSAAANCVSTFDDR